jgi:hypothetical protein
VRKSQKKRKKKNKSSLSLGFFFFFFFSRSLGQGKKEMEFSAIPKLVIPNQEFIACGPFSGASISTKGQLSYWGPNLVKKKEKPFKKPEKFTHKGHLVSVAIGREHMLMLDDTGELYAVGEGADGQLGTGYYDPQAEPVKVRMFRESKLVSDLHEKKKKKKKKKKKQKTKKKKKKT